MRFADATQLTRWARQAQRLWLFLDYDGTLAEFTATPSDPAPDPRVIEIVRRLSSDPHKRVAVISGRRLGDMQALLPGTGLFLGGTYGLDLQVPSGQVIRRANHQAIRPIVERVKSRWEHLTAGRAGFYLEDKGWAVALHARLADEADAAFVLARARLGAQVVLTAEMPFRILGGNRFLEVAPLGAHKGETVSFLLREFPWPEAQCLYVGDDDKDAEAYATVHASGGMTVVVTASGRNPCPPDADYCLDSPEAVRLWLATI